MQETRDTYTSTQIQVHICAMMHYMCADPFKIIIHAHVYTVITIFYVFVLISETLVSLYDACDLTYFSTTVPRTLESKCVKDKSKRFRASLVVLRKILCLGHFSIFYRYFFSLPLNIFLLLLLLLSYTIHLAYTTPLPSSLRRSSRGDQSRRRIAERRRRDRNSEKRRILRFFELGNEILTCRLKNSEMESVLCYSFQRKVRGKNYVTFQPSLKRKIKIIS